MVRGAVTAGAFAGFLLGARPSLWPCGALQPGFGMTGPDGELLVDAEVITAAQLEIALLHLDAALELGAGISHHHGIGRVRRDALRGELGESGISVLRAVKRALDPGGLLNPGVLLREEDLS